METSLPPARQLLVVARKTLLQTEPGSRERERACLPHLAVFSIRTTITIRVTGTPRLASHAASRGVTRRHSPSCVSSGLVSEKAWSETTRGDVKGPGAQNPLGEAHPALVHEPETSSELLDGTGVSL